jgi:RNA polymerase sigma-54 factor
LRKKIDRQEWETDRTPFLGDKSKNKMMPGCHSVHFKNREIQKISGILLSLLPMLNQRLQQRLMQKLSPQQVLVMRLLQEPLLALEQRIKQEIELNPALEELTQEADQEETEVIDDEAPVSDTADTEEDEYGKEQDEETTPNSEDDFTFEDYLSDDEIPEYRLKVNNTSPDDEIRETPLASGISFQEFLLDQVGMQMLTQKEIAIAQTIIGNLDETGYLYREIPALCDDLAFNHSIEATPEEVLNVLKVIQSFDPPGIGARTLQECLLLQVERKPQGSKVYRLVMQILSDYFTEFSKKHYDKIIQRTKSTEAELKEAIEEIQKLNPKPGMNISELSRENHYVVPDFIVTSIDGNLELLLNSRNTPELSVNRQYIEMLRSYSSNKSNAQANKEAISFIRQKVESAKGFIDAVKQRQQTLYITMEAIMEYQREYFLSGDETRLRPMILKDIASVVNLDISTVSRVANSKYVQTPFGTFLLKSFFSESMQNTKGEEISTREIKKILQDCVEAEDKSSPLTDDELMVTLKSKGYNIARRTIAKYREQLGIPVARMRKEL